MPGVRALGQVRTDNASRGFFRQCIAMVLSPRTDNASRSPEVVTKVTRGSRALRPLLSPRPMALGSRSARHMENPANRCEKRLLRVTSTGTVERSEAMATTNGGGQDRDQPRAGSGGSGRHSWGWCGCGEATVRTARCVVGPQPYMTVSEIAAFLGMPISTV